MIKSKKKKNKSTPRHNIACHPVEKIIGFYTGKEKRRYYRVQWTPSWIPEENLLGCESLIEQFFVEENIINKDPPVDSERKIKIKLEIDAGDSWHKEPKLIGVNDVLPILHENDNNEKCKKGKNVKKYLKIRIKDGAEEDIDEKKVEKKKKKEGEKNKPIIKGTASKKNDEKKEDIAPCTPLKTPPKQVARAMMTTSSPDTKTIKSNDTAGKKTNCEEKRTNTGGCDVTPRIGINQIKKDGDQKHQTRHYLKELRSNSRRPTKRGLRTRGDRRCKVYNTRLRRSSCVSENTRCRDKRSSDYANTLRYTGSNCGFGTNNFLSTCQKTIMNNAEKDIAGNSAAVKNKNVGCIDPTTALIKEEKLTNVDNLVDVVEDKNNNDVRVNLKTTLTSLTYDARKLIKIKNKYTAYNTKPCVIKQEPLSPQSFFPTTHPSQIDYHGNSSRESARKLNNDVEFNRPEAYSYASSFLPKAEYAKDVKNEEFTSIETYSYENSFLPKAKYVKEESHDTITESSKIIKNYNLRGVSGEGSDEKKRIDTYDSSDDSDSGATETPFECDVCEKMFQTSVLLHRHRFIHCENRPFSFNNRKPTSRKIRDGKENFVERKIKIESDENSQKLYSHHLRPRRDVKETR